MSPDYSEYEIFRDKEYFKPFDISGKYTPKSLKLHQDKDGYYLSAVYEIRNGDNIYELDIPRISLTIADTPNISRDTYYRRGHICPSTRCYINLGFGDLSIERINGIDFTLKTITEELTLEEIEKRLGYKVKIVSKK